MSVSAATSIQPKSAQTRAVDARLAAQTEVALSKTAQTEVAQTEVALSKTAQAIDRIGSAADHVQEWLESGVHPEIIRLNVETLTDTARNPNADSLFPIAERLNWSVHRFGQNPRPNLRGWWVSGIDPFTWQRMSWGRFKPDANTPVFDRRKNKPAKYLSPSLGSGSSRLILLDVPESIWQLVATRYGQTLPTDRSQGFWHWVWQQQVPVILTEGEKKAGCLLSLGYAAIALPGIFGGYRKQTRSLIPELALFATMGRSVAICFDFEVRPQPRQQIQLAILRLGQLLQTAGCHITVVDLPGPEKGVDDFVTQSSDADVQFKQLYESATPLELWRSQQLWALTHPADLVLNQPYLGNLDYPQSGLVCIKSAKGTGKTTALKGLIDQATQTGRKVLVITHRIQLGRAICQSVGIDWIEEVPSSMQSILGYGLCIDSLHANSKARFNPRAWKGAIVVLDEVEQVLWHALNSSTCYEHRVKILEALQELIQTVFATGGLLIAQDADLSDVSVDYIKGLSESSIQPWIVVNQWPEQSWPVRLYDTPNPAILLNRLIEIADRGAVFIAVDSQKARSRWSSKTLENYLHTKLPDKRILRIDSETVANPEHPAYGIVDQINQKIGHYDIVLATPTIGTGVSIEIKNHFQAVFGIFQGVTADAESRQALARVREAVPRHIWAAPFGPGKIGNGSCNYQEVVTSTTRFIRYNIDLLKEIDFDIDRQTDPVTLRTWAKMAARVNTSLWSFRQQLAQGLTQDGHIVTTVSTNLPAEIQARYGLDLPTLQQDLATANIELPGYELLDRQTVQSEATKVLTALATIKQTKQVEEATAVSTAPEIPQADYEVLKDQRSKTEAEQHAVHKYELKRRYGITVTSELKLKDDQGWFSQLRLHYYLIQNSALVRQRDYRELQGHLDRGEGKVALQDVRLLTAQVEALKRLEILNWLDINREVRASDMDVQQLAQYSLQCSEDIKLLFNLTISDRMTPIEILQALLSKLGVRLTCIRRDRALNGKRGGLRVYQYQPISDGREAIFAHWQQRDQEKQTINDPPPDIKEINLPEMETRQW